MSLTLIASRLKHEMVRNGINSVELARRADVKTSFIYDIVNGKSANPSPVKLARVAESLGISLSYLAGGDLEPDYAPAEGGTADVVSIPRIAVIASAGGGSVVTTEPEVEHYYFRRTWIRNRLGASPADLRMLFISGDSMEPMLCHNDIILVDTSKTLPSPPGVFVLFDGFGLLVKRLELISGDGEPRIRIISENPQYASYERSLEEIRVIGRIVWFAREI